MRTERAMLLVMLGALVSACSAPSPAPAAIGASSNATRAQPAAAAQATASPVENDTPTSTAVENAAPASTAPVSNAGAIAKTATPPTTVTTKPLEGSGSAQGLPEDVQAFIIKRRMCKHLSAASAEDAGDAKLAMRVCPGADADEWKALVKKYQGRDAITGVLLAERPPGIEALK